MKIELSSLPTVAGASLGPTGWVEVTQEQVNLFAEATGDHQWIHVDVDRAVAESPFGGPIAHGYLTLSLVNLFLPELITVTGASMGVNVGLEKVRFTSPLPVGSRIRARGEVTSVAEVKGGSQIVVQVTIEREQTDGTVADRPVCVADTVSRFLP